MNEIYYANDLQGAHKQPNFRHRKEINANHFENVSFFSDDLEE